MLKYRRCLSNGSCSFKADCPMTGEKGKRCRMTMGSCKYQGCQMIMPTNKKESGGQLIIDTLGGRF